MYRESILDNGLRIITSNMPHTRCVSLVFFIGVGSRYEADSEAGVSHFIEHVCFKGTKKRRSSREISEVIESIGGIINGGTDKELTTFWCMVTSQYFPLAADVLVDLLLNPLFDSQDIDRERQIIVEEINMSLDSPRQRVGMLIDEILWPESPLGRDVAGSKEIVNTMNREQMLDFFSSHYLPNSTIVSVAGEITHEQVQDILNQTTGNWKPDRLQAITPFNNKKETTKMNIEFRNTEQVQISIGMLGPSLHHPDRFAANLLSIVLGEGMSSRLFTEVREKRGLAYDIHSYTDNLTDTGAFFIHAGVDPKRYTEALHAIVNELSQIKDNISGDELKKAQEMAKGRLLMGMESSRNVAVWLGSQALLTDEILTVDEVIARINAVSVEDMQRIAMRLFSHENLNLAIVGPVREEQRTLDLLQL